jgi:hypothetical protein
MRGRWVLGGLADRKVLAGSLLHRECCLRVCDGPVTASPSCLPCGVWSSSHFNEATKYLTRWCSVQEDAYSCVRLLRVRLRVAQARQPLSCDWLICKPHHPPAYKEGLTPHLEVEFQVSRIDFWCVMHDRPRQTVVLHDFVHGDCFYSSLGS